MSFHLIHKTIGSVRNLSYRSGAKADDESEAWKRASCEHKSHACGVGFRLWANKEGRGILLINDDAQVSLSVGLRRLMDVYALDAPRVRPWRIFLITPSESNGYGLLYELRFKRDDDEYTLVERLAMTWKEFEDLVPDARPEFEIPEIDRGSL